MEFSLDKDNKHPATSNTTTWKERLYGNVLQKTVMDLISKQFATTSV
jgi:hypothetical protein